jgi:hypothetical protein
MAGESDTVLLFSYGTLRLADVQRATFGRLLEGRRDALAGFALSPMTITDPHVIATSGSAVHTIARPSGNPADEVLGLVFEISLAELEAADRYESGAIRRIRATLASGGEAFVYVSAEAAGEERAPPGRGRPSLGS